MKKKIRNISLIGWLLSLTVFIGILAWLVRTSGTFLQHDTLFKVFIGDILFGIIAFLALIVSLANSGNHIIVKENEIKEKPHIPINPWLVVGFCLLAIYAFQASRTGSLFLAQKEVITPTPVPINFSIPPNTPTPTSAPVIVKPIVTVDPDPIISCVINASCGGGSRQMKRSECNTSVCCLIDQKCGGPKTLTKSACDNSYCCFLSNGTGVLLASKSACDNYYSGSNKTTIPTYTNTYVDNSISCFVSYPCTGASYTFQLLPADCTNAQQTARNICNTSNGNTAPIATPTLTDSQAQSIIDQHNSQVQQCRSDVTYQYSGLIQGCNIRFGDSSAAEACVKIYSDDRQRAYDACGTTY